MLHRLAPVLTSSMRVQRFCKSASYQTHIVTSSLQLYRYSNLFHKGKQLFIRVSFHHWNLHSGPFVRLPGDHLASMHEVHSLKERS